MNLRKILGKKAPKATKLSWKFHTLTTISFTSVHNIAFYCIHVIVALAPAAVFSCFRRLLFLYSSHTCKCGPWCVCLAENNECIMWNGFLPQRGPGKQWSHKRGFVLREFQSRHFACPQCNWLCHPAVGCALHSDDDWLDTLLRVAGMRPRLCSRGDAVPQTQTLTDIKQNSWCTERLVSELLAQPWFTFPTTL